MAQYQAISFTYGEQPSAAKFNIIGTNFVLMNNALPPVGSVMFYHGDSSSIPGYWLLCNGQAISDTESPRNGLTVPNLVNKFVRAVAERADRAAVRGSDTVVLTTANLPNHAHTVGLSLYANVAVGGSGVNVTTPDNTGSGYTIGSSGTGSATPVAIVPSWVGLVPIIRYK